MSKKPVRDEDILFTVKFEDGSTVKMTARQIADMKERRRYDILNSRGVIIMKKVYRGV